MNLLRIGLFLLLSLALPINGMAQLLVSAKSCPMHQEHVPAMTHADGHDHDAMGHSGHEDMMDAAQPHAGCDHAQEGLDAKLCKSGLDCKTGSLFQAVLEQTPNLPLDRPGPFPLHFEPLPGQSEPLWHPPRA